MLQKLKQPRINHLTSTPTPSVTPPTAPIASIDISLCTDFGTQTTIKVFAILEEARVPQIHPIPPMFILS